MSTKFRAGGLRAGYRDADAAPWVAGETHVAADDAVVSTVDVRWSVAGKQHVLRMDAAAAAELGRMLTQTAERRREHEGRIAKAEGRS